MQPKSSSIKLDDLPRRATDDLRLKIAPFKGKREVFSSWAGTDLRKWRTAAPKMSQVDLAAALGVSRLTVVYAEKRALLSGLIIERMMELYDYFHAPSTLGPLPEEEFAELLGKLRGLSNRYRPLVGKGQLSEQVERLVSMCDESLLGPYQLSVKLQRASEIRRG